MRMHGNSIKDQLARGLIAHLSVEKLGAASNEQRIAEAERGNRSGDFPDMRWIEPTQLSRGWADIAERQVEQVELRQQVVSPPLNN